ncbi:MAG: metal ABC transporter ATP-binding protein [Anaerolineaceae bacterium]|nr:metal ABC transporter ATP-binding protein [Anaerolineaceae bacterium]
MSVTENQEVIAVKQVWAGYDKTAVLENINLSVNQGDFIGIIGPNGGGKTTLLKVLLGILAPMRGEVTIFGQPVREGRENIGYVPQLIHFDRDFPISVWEVVRMGRLHKKGLLRHFSSEDDEAVAAALDQVNMLALRDRCLGDLSGGQRQRVYIARALAGHPRILLLDEPTASVDPQVSGSIYELLHELNKHVSILLISHDMNAVSSYTKTIGCLNRTLHYHGSNEITEEMVQATYHCPVDLIAHGLPHRVLADHHGHTHTGDHQDD